MRARIFTFFVLVCFVVLIDGVNAQKDLSKNTATVSPKIILAREQITIPNPAYPGYSEENIVSLMYVPVSVEGVSSNSKSSDYKYTVSGGQIVGEGKDVQWN